MADEKYRLTLEGSEVDEALQMLVDRVPEGWAAGTANGAPVGSTSQYYHNNAKYYAEQAGASETAAEAAAARAEAAVPSGTAGAVFFDRAQSLTDGQKEQAKANIAAADSNENLLDNWDFLHPVNSRGKTSYAANGYGVDRWICYGGTQTVWSGGVIVPANGVMTQPHILPDLNGKTLTMTVEYEDRTDVGTAVLNLSGSTVFVNLTDGQAYITNSGLVQFYRTINYTVRRVKLEIGSHSTLAYDPPQNFGKELTRCIYSKADPSDTHANNGFGRSNENLLDNWYFVGEGSQAGAGGFPINQRGAYSYSGTQIGFDRWHTFSYSGSLSAELTGGGIKLHFGANAADEFAQVIPSNRMIVGETYTFSVQYQSGDIRSHTFVFGDSTIIVSADQFRFHIIPSWGGGTFFAILNLNANARDLYVRAVKLERGDVSTLVNDPPPNFQQELAKCQHYLYAVSFPGYAFTGQICLALDTQTINWNLITPVPMVQNRIPSITAFNSLKTNGVAISGLTSVNYPFGNNVKISGQASGLTGGQLYAITTAAEVKVLISTEP